MLSVMNVGVVLIVLQGFSFDQIGIPGEGAGKGRGRSETKWGGGYRLMGSAAGQQLRTMESHSQRGSYWLGRAEAV